MTADLYNIVFVLLSDNNEDINIPIAIAVAVELQPCTYADPL